MQNGVGGNDHDARGIDVSGEAATRELVDLARQGEGAGRGDALDEVGGVSLPGGLGREAGVVEVDTDGDLDGATRGAELVAAGPHVVRGRAGDAQARTHGGDVEESEGRTPGAGASVEQRQLGAFYLERHTVVKAQAGQRGERMLHRADAQVTRTPGARRDRRRPCRRDDLELADARLDRARPQPHWPGARTQPDA